MFILLMPRVAKLRPLCRTVIVLLVIAGATNLVAVTAPVITSPTAADATQDQAFSYQITADNGPTSFNASGLPSGLMVDTSTGLISGSPLLAGDTVIGLAATNVAGTGTGSLILHVIASIPTNAPVITS